MDPELAVLARRNRRGGRNRSRNGCDGAGCLAQVGDVSLPGVSNSSLGTSTIGNKRVRGGDLAQISRGRGNKQGRSSQNTQATGGNDLAQID